MPTLAQAGLGFAIGNGAAILMSVWFVHVASARRVFYPLAIILQSIPLIALTPIAIVTLGNGLTTKIVMVGLISFFPTLVNLMRGLSAVDVNMLQLFQSVHASRWKVLRKLRWPSALPYPAAWNHRIAKLAKDGRLADALHQFAQAAPHQEQQHDQRASR